MGATVAAYRYRRRVQFYETDLAGIVHFSWYFRYMEEAEHGLWRAAGLSIAPPGAEIAWVRVQASCDFHQPLRFEDEIDVAIRVAAIERKTIDYACEISRGDVTAATAAMRVICVRAVPGTPMRATDIPPGIAEQLRGARGPVDGA